MDEKLREIEKRHKRGCYAESNVALQLFQLHQDRGILLSHISTLSDKIKELTKAIENFSEKSVPWILIKFDEDGFRVAIKELLSHLKGEEGR